MTIPNRYYKFARAALELAGALDNGMTHQLCSLVVSKNQVLSVGYNSRKTHTMMSDSKMNMIHAECDALLRCASPKGVDVVVARAKPSGLPGLAKPCEVCEGILRRSGVRRVIYTTNCDSVDDMQLEEMRL
jgi:deoxycytidylate deaminase